MKTPQLMIFLVLAGLTVPTADTPRAIALPVLVAQNQAQNQPIPISLPTSAAVSLVNGGQRSGQLVEINSQYLIVTRGDSRAQEAIANVSRVQFRGDIWWPTSDGRIVIRGDHENTGGNPRRFRVRVDGLVWEDADKGFLAIVPEAVIAVDDQPGIPRGMKNIIHSRYVVTAIEFAPQNSELIITAKLLSPSE
ncbi:hypothetical protein [Arthrospira platensis]|uniref:hypothetical protein n=2 Tax=Sirenicapillariaceae TaxID=2934961 RepID=UPI0001D0E330|nr:hypothetical protein [Arthrospira platensis]AMW28105.1 hypothetical protein AP285_09100 [Arthrospira platensis YZ]KDR57237.1 hypothetical protein APPUASWS_011970 [Arthrospira platensis str. Paraca]MBD2670888.1 hypothetical protein [Arthrospira platensis FACHB-439]MBD2713082.1 hypothetical protein [Arthrospira platensis FACHB-835]MDF2209222.1 hypothetical protein [Arthrospira platensis NCB002]MDT9185615.1 hypothetical protein [Limnospira sp. PMC 289.06]MDT9297877.1 hypothetical protein [Ar